MSGLLWKDLWFDERRIDATISVLNSGYLIAQDGQIAPVLQGGAFNIPWIFTGGVLPHLCRLWNGIYFQRYNLIPKYCRTKCHKVVAKPRNIKETLEIYDLMQFINTKHKLGGKCGRDLRDYTFGPWAAFWYNYSLEKGLEAYKIISTLISQHLPGVKVILKKGCTEMEFTQRFPAAKRSSEWSKPTQTELEEEEHLDNMYHQGDDNFSQPDWLKQTIMFKWMKDAYMMGDETLLEVFPIAHETFGVISDTYHESPKPERKEVNKLGLHDGVFEGAPKIDKEVTYLTSFMQAVLDKMKQSKADIKTRNKTKKAMESLIKKGS